MSDRPAPSPRARPKSAVRPYPWSGLDAVTCGDASATRIAHRAGGAFGNADGVADALAGLLDGRVEVIVRRVRESAQPHSAEEGIGVLLAPADAPELARAVLVDVEPALGAALVARAVRRSGPRLLAPAASGDALAGAVAAVVLATARRVHHGGALRVLAAGPSRTLESNLASASGALLEASLAVGVNDDTFAARILAPRPLALTAPGPAWTRAELAALGEVALSLSIVATVSLSTAAEIGSLRKGDAWLAGAWPLHLAPSGHLAGPVLLAAGTGEVGFRALLRDDGRLVLQAGIAPLAWESTTEEEAGVSDVDKRDKRDKGDKDALVDAVGEVPVVVRVEIGVAEMRAREWASLAPGDIVALGKRVGDAVTLRVGGVTVARGELVDLEGEIGVRILGRSSEATDGTQPFSHGFAQPSRRDER